MNIANIYPTVSLESILNDNVRFWVVKRKTIFYFEEMRGKKWFSAKFTMEKYFYAKRYVIISTYSNI